MSAIHVLAIITTNPGKRREVLDLFETIVPTVLAEDGCIAYEATIDAEDAGPAQAELGPDTFVVVERWASLDALDAHANSDHMKAHGARTKDMLAARKIYILSPI